jgi:hypothetical protein
VSAHALLLKSSQLPILPSQVRQDTVIGARRSYEVGILAIAILVHWT